MATRPHNERTVPALWLTGALFLVACPEEQIPRELHDAIELEDGTIVAAGGSTDDRLWVGRLESDRFAAWQVLFEDVFVRDETDEQQAPQLRMAPLPDRRIAVATRGTLLALNREGTLGWIRRFGPEQDDPVRFVDVILGGDPVVVGQATAEEAPFVARFTTQGRLRSSFLLDSEELTELVAVRELRAGGLYLVGVAGTDVAAVAIDAEGRLMWARRVVTPSQDTPRDAVVVDGDELVVAATARRGGTGLDLAVFRMRVGGTLAWHRVLEGIGDELAHRIRVLDDGGFAVAAESNSFGERPLDDTDVWLVELDAGGGVRAQAAIESLLPDRPVALLPGRSGLRVPGQRGEFVEIWTVEGMRSLAGGCGRVLQTDALERVLGAVAEEIPVRLQRDGVRPSEEAAPATRDLPALPIPQCFR